MTIIEKSVRDYMNKIFTKEQIEEYSSKTLTFCYLTGMEPQECIHMDIEPEFTDEQVDEYDDVEGIINQIKTEIK